MKKIKVFLLLFSIVVLASCGITSNQQTKYTIKYITDIEIIDAKTSYDETSGIFDLPVIEKEGYLFLGWTIEGSTEIITQVDSKAGLGHLRLYPVFEEDIKTYTIEYVTDLEIENAKTSYTKKDGVINLPVLEQELYIFLGWTIKESDIIYTTFDTSSDLGNIKLYPVFAKSERLILIEKIDADALIAETLEELLDLESRYLELSKDERLYLDNIRTIKSKIADEKNIYKAELLAKEKAIAEYEKNYWPEDEEKYFNEISLNDVIAKLAQANEWIADEIQSLESMIEGLENPTLEEVKQVNELYLSSISYVKDNISNVSKLNEILESFNEEYFRGLAESVNAKINLLSKYIDLDDEEAVRSIKSEYDALPEESLLYVSNVDVLTSALQTIENIRSNKQEIAYVLGQDVFETKEDLYNSYYTDLYYFILASGGEAHLQKNNVNSLEDFLVLGVNPNGGGTTTMRGIGNIAGNYYLQRDYNGLLKDQPTTKFFGYMYQNNKYTEFLEFLVRFFAYWRIDEHYATETNRGADIFAEAWAPMVDTSKFFYYTNETTYVKTERMLDCFNHIPGVLYCDLPEKLELGLELPTNIFKRGYIFDGWYTNSDYSGNKVTTITQSVLDSYVDGKVVLYAKWVEDVEAMNKDLAATVDVIINNLMPTLEDEDAKIVAKARYMYDSLPEEAKPLVTLYDKLLNSEVMTEGGIKADILVKYNLNGGTFASFTSFEDMYQQFVSDFDSYTSIDISDPNAFINSRYSLMKSLYNFYQNGEMYEKWVFLMEYFNAVSNSRGLDIQSLRVINKESGDLEYVSKALGVLFLKQNALSDTEVAIDASVSTIFEDVINYLDTSNEILYTVNTNLKTPYKEGYKFAGWYIDSNFTTQVYSVKQLENHGVTEVYAKWEK